MLRGTLFYQTFDPPTGGHGLVNIQIIITQVSQQPVLSSAGGSGAEVSKVSVMENINPAFNNAEEVYTPQNFIRLTCET